VLRRALAGFADPEADPADPAQSAAGESTLQRAGRELSLVGGTAIAVTLICLGFVLLAAFGMIRRPERITLSLLGAAAFFGLGALIGVWMGLDRRAMLLGQRAPLSRLRPRWTRAGRAVATREGLALLDRKGATLYGWAAIAEISVGELYGNSALMVRLLEGALPLRVAAPGRSQVPSDGSRWARREARARAVQRALSGCDLAILGTMTDEGAGVLCRELSLAFADRAERCQLPTVEAALATHFLPPQRA
jgi:hypothetical protein